MLIVFTYLPGFVSMVFRGMPTVWRGRHRLIFCWLIFMQAVSPGRKTLEEMARWTPATITAWRFGRLLKAAYWNVHLIVKIPAASGGALEGRSLSCWGNLSPKPPNKDAIPPHRKQWGILASFRELRLFVTLEPCFAAVRPTIPMRHHQDAWGVMELARRGDLAEQEGTVAGLLGRVKYFSSAGHRDDIN